MKTLFPMLMIMFLVLAPAMTMAQNYSPGGQAPIAQPLVREGTMAVWMVEALQLGTAADEVEAENLLLDAGIAPRNGWISDYPVTPDIASELQDSVIRAAEAGSLKLGRDEAAQAFESVLTGHNLMVKSDTSTGVASGEQPPVYHDNTLLDEYYDDYGPPPVTYYAPPVYYANLYSWVPYPFWGWNAWFPGFFVLADFHRFVYVDKRVYIVSNHFFDHRKYRHSRIDARTRSRDFPDRRFDDRDHRRRFTDKKVVGPSAVRKDAIKAFTGEHKRTRLDADRGRTNLNSSREMRRETREVKREGRKFNFSGRKEGRIVTPSVRAGNRSESVERTFRPWSDRGGHRELKSPSRTINTRHLYAPSGGGKSISRPVSDRGFNHSSGGARGVRSFSGSGERHRR